jgi:hypothetical protein
MLRAAMRSLDVSGLLFLSFPATKMLNFQWAFIHSEPGNLPILRFLERVKTTRRRKHYMTWTRDVARRSE